MRKKLRIKKSHPRKSYDLLFERMLESDYIPSLEEMFRIGDKIKQKRKYTTEEVIKMCHELREKR